jgi:hypothetical protein
LYHGRTGGIFSAPMNKLDGSGNYKPQKPSVIQPETALDFFHGTQWANSGTDFTDAVIDPNATDTHNVRQTTDSTGGTGPYIGENGYFGRYDTENHYLFGGSRH